MPPPRIAGAFRALATCRLRRGLARSVTAALLVAGCGEAGTGEWQGRELLAIEGATVFTSPWEPPLENGVVFVVDGVIEAVGLRGSVPIPAAALRIEADGSSLLPGFWNAHVRIEPELLEASALASDDDLAFLLRERFARYGFTTVVETGTPRDQLAALVDRIESGAVPGPRILALGGVQVPGVHWAAPGELLEGEGEIQPPGGPDTAFSPNLAQAREEALRAPPTEVLGPVQRLQRGVERLEGFLRGGGELLFGTGAGYVEQYDPLPDLLLLEDAGIPFPVLLAALTTVPSDRFGFLYLGAIEAGMVADLVMVEGDPEGDATALGRVQLVLREGRPLFVR